MKKIQYSVFLVLASLSTLANARAVLAPEMDGSMAVLGLGLLAGVIALVAERRSK